MKYINLIIGAGITGATLARRIAEEQNEQVVVIDTRQQIGGNLFDERQDGIMLCKYGAHIFHTNDKRVWDFLSRFTKWHPYQHEVRGLIDGQLVPIPFNLNSIRQVFPACLADKIEHGLIDVFGFGQKVPILELRNTRNKELDILSHYVYEKVFLEYTRKQWGLSPNEIDPEITGRVPVVISRDNRYFQDKYQGYPLEGFTAMIQAMLAHPNITVELNTSYDRSMTAERLFYTGAIDEFFDYQLGELPYRSLRFDVVRYEKPHFQDTAIVNYPCDYDWTRIGEHKWFLDDQTNHTIVSYEYPESFELGKNERYYPFIGDKNREQYNSYLELAKEMTNVHFFGRLGEYRYVDIDQAVARVLVCPDLT